MGVAWPYTYTCLLQSPLDNATVVKALSRPRRYTGAARLGVVCVHILNLCSGQEMISLAFKDIKRYFKILK